MVDKPPLKLWITDTVGGQFFLDLFATRYTVTLDKDNPDFVLFGDENFGTQNRNYSRDRFIKIFYTAENRRPQNYDCHYALTGDHINEPWHYRFPPYAPIPYGYPRYPFNTMSLAHTLRFPKDRFCLFAHRNPGCPERNFFFQELSKYKKVDAVGRVFHNVDFTIGENTYDKVELCKRYKFLLSFENGSYPGYVTEKLVDGFYAAAVPIYWGSPTIDIDFDPRSFINCHDYKRWDEVIKRIIEVDENDALYEEILSVPKLRHGLVNECMRYEPLLNWWGEVVMKRRNPRG